MTDSIKILWHIWLPLKVLLWSQQIYLNGEEFTEELGKVDKSVYGKDPDFPKIKCCLAVLNDIVHTALSDVKNIISMCTGSSAMMFSNYRSTFSEICGLPCLYLTVPITSATSERVLLTLIGRRILTYLRFSLTEKGLNNCILRVHKDLLDEIPIAKSLVSLNSERMCYFESFTIH